MDMLVRWCGTSTLNLCGLNIFVIGLIEASLLKNTLNTGLEIA